MAITYAVNTSLGTVRVGRSFKSTITVDTYTLYRSYFKFDLSALGLVVGDIDTVVFRVYCSFIVGAISTHRLRSTTTVDNWGTILEASEADWASTNAYNEDENTISVLEWYEFAVDKTHLDLSGTTYFRISDIEENGLVDSLVYYASQNAASNRPVLRITLRTGIPPGVEKQIVSFVCSEKIIVSVPCTERVVPITLGTEKVIIDCTATKKTIASVSPTHKAMVSYLNTEKVIQ